MNAPVFLVKTRRIKCCLNQKYWPLFVKSNVVRICTAKPASCLKGLKDKQSRDLERKTTIRYQTTVHCALLKMADTEISKWLRGCSFKIDKNTIIIIIIIILLLLLLLLLHIKSLVNVFFNVETS